MSQVGLGLFAVDEDGIESGPLSHLVDFDTGRILAERHHQLFNLLLALIALHIGAILFYALVKRRNLVSAMITGHAPVQETVTPLRFAGWARAAIVALIAAAIAWFVANGLRL
jgi:cytochrome b